MTKSKFLSLAILFFVSAASFGVEAANSEKIVSTQIIESTSSQNIGEIEINQEIEKISPPFRTKLNQSRSFATKACHRQKIGPIIIAIVTGVGVLGFVGWAIATNV